MELDTLLQMIGVALGGGGIVRLLDWRADRRKAKAEAQKIAAMNKSKTN